MSYKIDEIAKTLASPMPRRKMIVALARVLGIGSLGMVAVRPAAAAACGARYTTNDFSNTGGTQVACGTSGGSTVYCATGDCCTSTSSHFCCPGSAQGKGTGTCCNGSGGCISA